MRKNLLPLIIVLAFLLSACGSATPTQAAPTAASTTAPVASDGTQPTAAPFTDAANPCESFDILNKILIPETLDIPIVTSDDWAKGPENAAVTLLVYSDIQCPYCALLEPILSEVQAKFPNDVRIVFRHWPLSFHANAPLAAQATEAAGRQGKFFEMLDLLFSTNCMWNSSNGSCDFDKSEWASLSTSDFTTYLKGKALTLGLDETKFTTDLNDPAIVEKIKTKQTEGNTLGLQGTPTLYINGSTINPNSDLNDRSVQSLTSIINLIKNQGEMQKECPSDVIDDTQDYFATLTTTKGDIVIDLLEKVAPYAVNSFINLAQRGWYTDNAFYLVVDEYALTGDKANTRYGGPGYIYLDEINPEYTLSKEGIVAMYNLGPGTGTNGSQFFITKSDMHELNGMYTIFGKVTEGIDILNALNLHKLDDTVESADKILSVTINTQ